MDEERCSCGHTLEQHGAGPGCRWCECAVLELAREVDDAGWAREYDSVGLLRTRNERGEVVWERHPKLGGA